jgi:hypothetical protein
MTDRVKIFEKNYDCDEGSSDLSDIQRDILEALDYKFNSDAVNITNDKVLTLVMYVETFRGKYG